MDVVESVTTAAVALLGLAAAIVQKSRGRSAVRGELEQDLRIYAALPATSSQKEPLAMSIDSRVGDLISSSDHRRDPVGVSIAIIFLAVAAGLGWAAANNEGLLRAASLVGVFFFGLFGVVGLVQDAVKRPRDSRGRPLRS